MIKVLKLLYNVVVLMKSSYPTSLCWAGAAAQQVWRGEDRLEWVVDADHLTPLSCVHHLGCGCCLLVMSTTTPCHHTI